MLEDTIHPQDQHISIEGMTSPIGAQMLEFCESELFPDSEVASSSNRCYEDHSSYQTQLNNIHTSDMEPPASTPTAGPAGNLSAIFDEDQLENDISASIDFTAQNHHTYTATMVPIPPLSTSYNDELRSSQTIIHEPMFLSPFSAETFTGMHLEPNQELDFQGDNNNAALFLADNITRVFNCSSELQGVSYESQHVVHGGASGGATVNTSLASEISSLEDPNYKVGKLSVEERRRKIHRYMKKRNERNFSKKIKYACRKTLADSRPRVRGRFAKNDELGEVGRNTSSNHEDETDEDVIIFANSIITPSRKVGVKEEDDMESSEILAHISGVNSFKCNYPIQSWI